MKTRKTAAENSMESRSVKCHKERKRVVFIGFFFLLGEWMISGELISDDWSILQNEKKFWSEV